MSPVSGLHIGYRRARQPAPPPVEVTINHLIADAAKLVDGDCPRAPRHEPFTSCGETVCFHCGRIFWR